MTRSIVYGMSLWATVACTAMTIASIVIPKWVGWNNGSPSTPHITYGLHKRCSSVTGTCDPFPQDSDCLHHEGFCSMWRTVGFFMSFTVLIELATIVGFIIIILGGKQSRDYGWKVICPLLLAITVIQCAGMAIVVYVFDHDSRFFTGWSLDTSWILCTVSWSLALLTAIGMGAATYVLPEEGGYEMIPDEQQYLSEDAHFGRDGISSWLDDQGGSGGGNGGQQHSYQNAWSRDSSPAPSSRPASARVVSNDRIMSIKSMRSSRPGSPAAAGKARAT